MQTCDQTCASCARDFFRWLKGRMQSAQRPSGRSGGGSFADAAATSIIGDAPAAVQLDALRSARPLVLDAARQPGGVAVLDGEGPRRFTLWIPTDDLEEVP
jgi:hypothetical protein